MRTRLVLSVIAIALLVSCSRRFPAPEQIDEGPASKTIRPEVPIRQDLVHPEWTAQLVPVDEEAARDLERHMVIGRTNSPPRIDGNLTDAAWQNVSEGHFVKSREGEKPDATTTFQLIYDDANLYLRFRCFEKGQETQREGPALRDDSAIFRGDCMEIFLLPGDPDTSYYQIVANPAGGLWDERWTVSQTQESWNSEGIRIGGRIHPDTWTLEMAIPFVDLGLSSPTLGTSWRVNFCRTEIPSQEWTCWSPTGGGYHNLERFGHLEFAAEPQAQETLSGTYEVSGYVFEENGLPVVGVPVRAPADKARTDTLGGYRLSGFPEGGSLLQIKSPRYETFTARFEIDEPKEILSSIVLKRRDPYLPAFRLDAVDHPVTWLTSSITEPPDMETTSEITEKLVLLAVPGEYESRAVAFYAHHGIDNPEASIEGPQGLAASAEVRWTQRMLKRIQYTRAREDAVFRWRFLWREPPPRIETDHLRHLVLTVGIPEDTAPGLYQGQLVLRSKDRVISTLPVELTVVDVHLVTPEKRVGCYYRGHRTSDDQIRIELEDIRQHGGSVLVWHAGLGYARDEDGTVSYDTRTIRRVVRLQQQFGIGPPFLVGTNPHHASRLAGIRVQMTPEHAQEMLESSEFRRIYTGGLDVLADLEDELGAGEFLYTWMDEVIGRGRFEPWSAIAQITREHAPNRIYITLHNRVQESVDAADPYVDVRGYHGHTLDWWIGEGHTFDDLKAELERAGDEGWTYYNIRDVSVTPEWVRLCNGYWLWRSPIEAHTPWIYYAFSNSAFDDMDDDRHDFAYAAPHPSKSEMVSSLEWECFREGYDDLRYLATLEAAVTQAEEIAPDHPSVKTAQDLLQTYWDTDPRVPIQVEALRAEDYHRRREAMVRAIEELNQLLETGG